VPRAGGSARYTDCNLSPRRGVTEKDVTGNTGETVFSCDYNGWADVPEEEREAIEAFEAAYQPPTAPAVPRIIRVPPLPAPGLPSRKAA
jgi:hypothetical protein